MTDGAARKVRLEVGLGLYVLRYVTSIDVRTAPIAFVRPADGHAADITVLVAPGTNPEELAAPGSGVAVLVNAPGAIDISIEPFRGSSNLDARFSLDLIATGASPQNAVRTETARGNAVDRLQDVSADPVTIDIMAHVSRRGDIKPDADGWIAGPKSPSAIEGMVIKSHRGEVAVAAQYINAANPQNWSAWLTPGSFIGTRQKATPITGLRLKLVGADASRFEIEGEALFLGSPRIVQSGNEVEFAVAGGSDPLVGFRLSVNERHMPAQIFASPKASRVRVFR